MGFAGFLRQSTAVDVKIGPFVDSTNGDTEETALTISNTDVILSKNGQTGAAKSDVTACAHAEDGMYNCELDATDTNTVGQLTIGVHEAGSLFVRHDFQVIEENVYDAWFAASAAAGTDLASVLTDTGTSIPALLPAALVGGRIDANVGAISADATAADNAEAFFDGTGYAGTGNVIPTVTTLTGHTAQTGDNYARLGAPAGASVSADIATVDSNVDAVLVDTGTTLPATLGSPVADLATDIAGVQTDTTAIVADTNELQTDWANGGRLDLLLDATALEATVAALNDLSAADVNTQVDAAWTTQMADSVATDGTISTREQALYALMQILTERVISGTTLTINKVDGSTALMTFTLNSAETPTSQTRAT